MSYPHKLPSLTDREAIADALYRVCIGIDTNDRALYSSAWVPTDEACFEMAGNSLAGQAEIHKVFDRVGPMDTSHHVSNVRVNHEDGAEIANATAYGLHQHYRPGEGTTPGAPRLLVGGRYDVDLVKDQADGLWKMKKWGFHIVWREGDASIMQR